MSRLSRCTIHTYSFFAIALLLLFAPVAAQDSKENAEFKLAVGLYNDQMYDLALEQLKSFVTAYPNTAQGIEARFYLGLVQLKLKAYDEARVTFQNFALSYVEHPKAPEAWINVGEAFLAAGNLREAASAFERVKIFHPKSQLAPEGLVRSAELHGRLGDHERAKNALRSVINDYPSSKSVLPARLLIGEMYAAEGQTSLAFREARRVSESDAAPTVKAAALFSIGRMQASNSLFPEAEATFSSVIVSYKTTPTAAFATLELGKIEQLTGKSAKAIEHLKAASIETSLPDTLQAEALFELGKTYASQKDHRAARKSFEKIFTSYPTSSLASSARLFAARAAIDDNDAVNSLQILQPLIAEKSKPELRRRALVLAGEAAEHDGRTREAGRYYVLFRNEFPNDAHLLPVLMRLATLYKDNERDCRKAMGVYDQVLEQFPQSTIAIDALYGIAECQEAMEDFQGAVSTLRDIQERYPANDRFEDIAKRITYLEHHTVSRQNDGLQKLARLLGDVIAEPTSGSLAYDLGRIYFYDLKDYIAAAKQFAAVRERTKDSDEHRIDAELHLARSYARQSKRDSSLIKQALQTYANFLQAYSSSPQAEEATYEYCDLLLQSGKATEAITAGENFLQYYTSGNRSADIRLALAELALRQNNAQLALRYLGGLSPSSVPPFVQSEALYLLGLSHEALNHKDSAIVCWKRAAEIQQPSSAGLAALWKLSEVFRAGNQYTNALESLTRVRTDFYYSSRAQEAEELIPAVALAGGQTEAIVALCEERWKRIANDPFTISPSGDDLYYLARAFERKGERQRAYTLLHEYLHTGGLQGPRASEAFYALGNLGKLRGEAEAASSYFKQAANLGGTASLTREIADLLFDTEQYSDAAKAYAALAIQAPADSVKRYLRARVIVANLRMDKTVEASQAIGEYEKSFGKDDKITQAEFEYEKGLSFYRKQGYADARKSFEKVAGDFEGTRFGPWANFYLGKIHEVSNKLEEAAKKYESIIQKFPASDVIPRVNLALGNMHFNVERYEEASRYYQRILAAPEHAPDILPYAINNLIEAYESLKMYDAALKLTREYIEKYPNDEAIIDKKIKLGTLYTRVGYYDQAIAHFQNLLGEAGSLLEAELRYDIAEAYYYKGDYQQAILEFLKVPYLVSKQGKVDWTATSFYMAGQSYEKLSKFEEAVGMYQQIVDRAGIDATFKAAARKEIDRVRTLTKK